MTTNVGFFFFFQEVLKTHVETVWVWRGCCCCCFVLVGIRLSFHELIKKNKRSGGNKQREAFEAFVILRVQSCIHLLGVGRKKKKEKKSHFNHSADSHLGWQFLVSKWNRSKFSRFKSSQGLKFIWFVCLKKMWHPNCLEFGVTQTA